MHRDKPLACPATGDKCFNTTCSVRQCRMMIEDGLRVFTVGAEKEHFDRKLRKLYEELGLELPPELKL